MQVHIPLHVHVGIWSGLAVYVAPSQSQSTKYNPSKNKPTVVTCSLQIINAKCKHDIQNAKVITLAMNFITFSQARL